MNITGYRHGADLLEAAKAIHKHTEVNLQKAKTMINDVTDGKIVSLPNDFVLREDLEDAGFTVE
jgi:hypothetical protein